MEIAKKIKDYPIVKENPFVPNLLVPKRNQLVTIADATNKTIVNTLTGEEEKGLMFATRQEIDKEEFVKLFHSQIQQLFNLSKPALKIFGYLAVQTTFDKDKVLFDLEDCMKETGYSSKERIYSGLIELLDREIIARASKAGNLYHINPAIFFKGDRLVLLKEYTVKKVSKISNKNQLAIFENEKPEKTENAEKSEE